MENITNTAIGAVVIVCLLSVVLVPVARVLRRVGFSRWYAILWIIPVVNIFALWTFAFIGWPLEKRAMEAVL